MLGVITDERHKRTTEEFFQLFKTPWEFAVPGKYYDAVLTTTNIQDKINASLFVIYSSKTLDTDSNMQVTLQENMTQRALSLENEFTPLFKHSAILSSPHPSLAFYHDSEDVAAVKVLGHDRTIFRLGYDLLDEIECVLGYGQPVEMAFYPTLDAHINLLRRLILLARIPLVEIPPTPPGYLFSAALTHDVDFGGIRAHAWDHSMIGFLNRATIGSLRRWLTGRLSFKETLSNWLSVLSLPLVMAGWMKDFWMQFDEYIRLEQDFKSTFFIIPFKKHSGYHIGAPHAKRRATKYDAADIQDVIKKLLAAGKEVALHGVDAWNSPIAAIIEKERIESFTARESKGIRMHWLCYSKESPVLLDNAGFEYDSTVGYNKTIGFKAGTLQVFKPLECRRLLELPLHIQDVAMFFPAFKDWKPKIAWFQCLEIFNQAEKHGGVVTLLWHERSLGPERQWGRFYKLLLRELQRRKAWVTSASEIVGWFRARRQITFSAIKQNGQGVRVRLEGLDPKCSLSFTVRVHPGDDNRFIDVIYCHEREIFIPFQKNTEVREAMTIT